MYGMVNKAIEEMITSRYGERTWETIKALAGVDVDVFISNEAYPDAITYELVRAASEHLGLASEAILEAFGMHWVLHTALEGYGVLLDAGGATLPEFLCSLPTFHTRVALIFPNLTPPVFKVTELQRDSLHLHYVSRRQGLAPFVVGILKGLGIRFRTEVVVSVVQCREQGAEHEEFLVTWNANANESSGS
jgi:hypothetical protein